MTSVLSLARQAFRRLYRLPPDRATPHPPPDKTESLLAEARRHRIAGLLYAAGNAGRGDDAWRRFTLGQTLHSTRYSEEAERIWEVLDGELKHTVLIKGPALAVQAWPDPGLRFFDDLDLRCHRDDYPVLCRLLLEAGYRQETGNTTVAGHYWHFGWGNKFHHPEGFMVEVNHRCFPPHFPWPGVLSPANDQHCMMQKLNSRPVRTPGPALHLLIACAHALWHGGQRLAWIVDIAGLLARHPKALSQAEAMTAGHDFSRRALHTGCATAAYLFGRELAPERLPGQADTVREAFIEQLRTSSAIPPSRQRSLHYPLMKTRSRISYTTRRALVPGDGDFHLLNLPAGLRPLYWLFRPARIAGLMLQRAKPRTGR